MSLNESIVEDAALILPAATLTRPLPREEVWEVGYAVGRVAQLLSGELRAAAVTTNVEASA
ncbi:MAG: hypothetical protein ABI273_12825 [Lacunisphaera sp.]